MKRLLLWSIILPVFASCQQPTANTGSQVPASQPTDTLHIGAKIGEIPVPAGFHRVTASQHSFAQYLRSLPLRKDRTVYLYNGQLKSNQDAQYAVIDLAIGKKDLQQCADAVMRLRAEYLYSVKKYEEIQFIDNANRSYKLSATANRRQFEQYLEKVFSYCGTLSLEQQLHKRGSMNEVSIGDVLIKGGSPGHAMLVVDLAVNEHGMKIVLLSQGYMPAQDIQVVINPKNGKLSPWYPVDNESAIVTPEWVFKPSELRHW